MYNQENKICSFSVNDYHLATILMPYIYEAINEGKKIITFFERDLKEISEKVINTNPLFWKNKDKFEKNIELEKTHFDKLAEKFENIKDNDIVIVVGKIDFIERINRLVINFHTKFTLVNCFDIGEIAKDENFKISDYGKILNTKGLEEIPKPNFV